MISHKHKCIFIHISKCAGSTIEKAFGIDVSDNSETYREMLFGWDEKNKIHLQHATPQQLFDMKYLNKDLWDSYYKIIVVRNPYKRALSDYFWISKTKQVKDSFKNFLLRKGKFKAVMSNRNNQNYRGDHLNTQKSYFFLDNVEIKYDAVIKLENFNEEISRSNLAEDLKKKIMSYQINSSNNKFTHYSLFYNNYRRKLVEKVFKEDIDFLGYKFEDKRATFIQRFSLKSSRNYI